jgi:hypothetical protein
MYAISFGGFMILPFVDLIHERFNLPSLMKWKRKFLSLLVMAIYSRVLTNLSQRWILVYMITGEFQRDENERLRLFTFVILSLIISGEMSTYFLVSPSTLQGWFAFILSLYFNDTSYIGIYFDPVSWIWQTWGVVKLVMSFYVNYYGFQYILSHPMYLPILFSVDPRATPRETWDQRDFENLSVLMLLNGNTANVIYAVYARFMQWQIFKDTIYDNVSFQKAGTCASTPAFGEQIPSFG